MQVGNRFLSLPEHSTTSPNKQDLRSDLTFCVGILFFVLTGVWPGVLMDETNKAPHQRAEARDLLNRLPERQRHRILHIFDLGFSLTLAQRWQTVEALRAELERAAEDEPGGKGPTDLAIARLRQRAASKK